MLSVMPQQASTQEPPATGPFGKNCYGRKDMSRFRQEKKRLLVDLAGDGWEQSCNVDSVEEALALLGPLLAMLPRAELHWRAAHCLGKVVTVLASLNREAARNFMRRLMWSLNEESGNLGWGIPETMGSIVAQSPIIAEEYERITISYIIDTGKSSNYIDHGPLRMLSYWAIGHVARHRKEALWQALPWLVVGLEKDDHLPCRGMAAWAIAQLAEWYEKHGATPEFQQIPMWRQALPLLDGLEGVEESFEVFEDLRAETLTCAEAALRAQKAIEKIV